MARSPSSKRERRSIREESRAVYRQAIREAAMRVFGRTGYREAKITDIASEAGVATGTLYNYFSSKEDIFNSIREESRNILRASLEKSECIGDPIERMRERTRLMLGFLEDHGALFSIHMQTSSLHDMHQDDDDAAFRREILEMFIGDIDQAGERMRQDYPSLILATAVGGLIQSTILMWVEAGCPAGLRENTKTIMDLFLHGAAKR